MEKKKSTSRNIKNEANGWLQMILIMFMFPALFYLCIFFPIWVGLTPRW